MWKQLHFLHHGQIVVHYNKQSRQKLFVFKVHNEYTCFLLFFICIVWFFLTFIFFVCKRSLRQQILHILLSSLYCVNFKLLRFNISKKNFKNLKGLATPVWESLPSLHMWPGLQKGLWFLNNTFHKFNVLWLTLIPLNGNDQHKPSS